MPDLQGMSIDIDGLMAEVENFRKRLAQLGDELTLKSEKNALDAAERRTLRGGRIEEGNQAPPRDLPPDAVTASAEPESELAALVRSAFAHKTRRSRRG